jgi:hypothetical protein
MQGKDTTISTFNQFFKPVCTKKFRQQVKEMKVDKYAKKLYAHQLIKLIAKALLEQHRGLRDISNSIPDFIS